MENEAIRDGLDRIREPGAPRLELLGAGPGGAGRPATIGLVAGSFDPLTVAHVALAGTLGTELTLFVYSPATLPKEAGPGGEVTPPLLTPETRVASLLAYCDARAGLGVALSSHGLYVDQAVAAAGAFPGSRLVFGLGSDKLIQLADPSWYVDRDGSLDELFSRAEVTYAPRRADYGAMAAALEALARWSERLRPIELPESAVDVSSRGVRDVLRRGADVSELVPSEVRAFLRPAGA